jgi:5'-3' exonuclease
MLEKMINAPVAAIALLPVQRSSDEDTNQIVLASKPDALSIYSGLEFEKNPDGSYKRNEQGELISKSNKKKFSDFFIPLYRDTVKDKFNLYPHNFIIYKTLLGDQSDSLPGIKGLGAKKLFKLFPELSDQKLSLDDIFELSQERIKEHIIYARILSDIRVLEDKYKIMDLSNPMIDDESKIKLLSLIKDLPLEYHPDEFIKMYHEDQIEGLIKNVEFWLKNHFQSLISK